MYSELRKSVYIFLCSLLGIMLFLALHRILISMVVLWLNASSGYNPFFGFSYLEFLALDYVSLIIAVILGAWYGIWLCIYWYKKVYEEGTHGGLVSHIATNYWPNKTTSRLKAKIEVAQKHLRDDLWQLEDLSKSLPATQEPVKPIKRRIVRKKAPKTLAN